MALSRVGAPNLPSPSSCSDRYHWPTRRRSCAFNKPSLTCLDRLVAMMPAWENSLSTPMEVDGMDSKCTATLNSSGNLLENDVPAPHTTSFSRKCNGSRSPIRPVYMSPYRDVHLGAGPPTVESRCHWQVVPHETGHPERRTCRERPAVAFGELPPVVHHAQCRLATHDETD